jgi:hypothetical protein
MIGSLMRMLRDPMSQEVARTNAQQAAARLAHRRRQRDDVNRYLAQLKVEGPANERRADGQPGT